MIACQRNYRGADKSLARPTSPCVLFDGENISFDTSLIIYIYIYIYINSTNIPPIMIINRIYETQNLLSFLVGLRTYQHPCTLNMDRTSVLSEFYELSLAYIRDICNEFILNTVSGTNSASLWLNDIQT